MQFVMFIDLFSKGFKLLLVAYTDVIFISYTVFLISLGTRYKNYHCRTNQQVTSDNPTRTLMLLTDDKIAFYISLTMSLDLYTSAELVCHKLKIKKDIHYFQYNI